MATVAVSKAALTGYAKLKAGLVEAQSTLVAMITDPAKRDAGQQAEVAKLADEFNAMLVGTKPPAGREELTER